MKDILLIVWFINLLVLVYPVMKTPECHIGVLLSFILRSPTLFIYFDRSPILHWTPYNRFYEWSSHWGSRCLHESTMNNFIPVLFPFFQVRQPRTLRNTQLVHLHLWSLISDVSLHFYPVYIHSSHIFHQVLTLLGYRSLGRKPLSLRLRSYVHQIILVLFSLPRSLFLSVSTKLNRRWHCWRTE